MSLFVIATRNRHKTEEIRAMLGSAHRYLTLADLPGAPAVVEDAPTFEGNAAKKARELAGWLALQKDSGLAGSSGFVLADDSGLEVDALDGGPGVLSARFAALDTGAHGNSPDAENNAKLLRLLANVPEGERSARFRCVIALAPLDGGEVRLFSGSCEGAIGFAARGDAGFGYDPLFYPAGYQQSFAELGEEVKNRISHRANALRKLAEPPAA
jgi:XTP/dITP diphosphohydrolase